MDGTHTGANRTLARAIESGAWALFASDVAASRAAPAYIVVADS